MANLIDERRLEDVVSARAIARLKSFRRAAEKALPGRVDRVLLFGSRARGEARRDSDYDVAVLVHGLEDRRLVTHILSDVALPHILAGTHIRPIALPADYLRAVRREALANSIAREGVEVP